MRWLSFFILAYVAIGLQLGISHAMEWHQAKPYFSLLAVVFIALNAPRDAALLGAFILGILQDITTQGTMGLYAFSYGCVAMFIFSIQSAVYRKHPLTQFVLTLIAGLITATTLTIHDWLRPPGSGAAALFYSAIYTAILAPFIIGFLQRIGPMFGFDEARGSRSVINIKRS
jgi:rod shape-determining protein MreD